MSDTRTDLRIAVIGVGKMGAFHVDSLSRRTRGARVTVVNDVDPDRAAEVAGRVGARVETDAFAAISADDVDAVVLASPGFVHEKQVLACLEAGRPVLCEKPLTMDEPSAYAVVQAEAELGRPLIQVGFMRRFDDEYAGLRELIVSGGIGSPLMMHCVHRNPAVPDSFTSEMAMADSVVHEIRLDALPARRGGRGGHGAPSRVDVDRPVRDLGSDARAVRDRVRPTRRCRVVRPHRGGLRGAHRGRR